MLHNVKSILYILYKKQKLFLDKTSIYKRNLTAIILNIIRNRFHKVIK